LNGSKGHGIDNGRGKKPESQKISQDVFDVSEMDRERRNQEAESYGKDELNKNDQWKKKYEGGKSLAHDGNKKKKNRKAK
jgi:hypothetical protein